MSEGMLRPPAQFERSICACTACTRFCTQHPGYLIPSDIIRIADHLVATGRIPEIFDVFGFLRASKGAVVGRMEPDGSTKHWRIGTITPRLEQGRCVFLTTDNRCSIHAVSPFACAYFSSHDDKRAADVRSLWGLRLIAGTPAYELAREGLIKENGEHEPFTG